MQKAWGHGLTVSCLATIVFVQTTFFSFPFLMAADTCKWPLWSGLLCALLCCTGKCTLPLLLCNIFAPLAAMSFTCFKFAREVL